MNSRLIIVGVIVFALIGLILFMRKPATSPSITTSVEPTKNIELMMNGNNTEVATEADVAYFPESKGYFVRPADDVSYPGVVVIHENRGLRPEIKSAAEQLAKEGYLVLAVDLYKGQIVESQDQARSLSSGFNQEIGTQNLRAAAKYLRDKGATKIASLGWCFGGRQSLALATSGEPLDATVVYYGGGMPTTTEQLMPISWPVLGVFGDQDQAIPVEKVKEFEASLNKLGIENEVYIYPGVGHAFANPSGQNYNADATRDAWTKTTAFLASHLK